MKYRIMGHTTVTVSCVIDTKETLSPEEQFKRAQEQFGGIKPYGGNGGAMKLIGVSGEQETIAADDSVMFDDWMEE